MYQEGIGVVLNYLTALEFSKAGCNINYEDLCTRIGYLFRNGGNSLEKNYVNNHRLKPVASGYG